MSFAFSFGNTVEIGHKSICLNSRTGKLLFSENSYSTNNAATLCISVKY